MMDLSVLSWVGVISCDNDGESPLRGRDGVGIVIQTGAYSTLPLSSFICSSFLAYSIGSIIKCNINLP